jgi:O-antigen ligase
VIPGGLGPEHLALGLAVAIIGTAVAQRLERQAMFTAVGLILLQGLAPLLQGLAASIETGGTGEGVTTGTQVLIGQAASAGMYLVAIMALIRHVRPSGGDLLTATAMAWGLLWYVTNVVNAGEPLPSSIIKFLLAVTALHFARSLEPGRVAVVAKWVIGAVLLVSLAGGLAGIPWMWRDFEGAQPLLPGITARFQGLEAHPNSLAPLPLVYLVLERLRPSPPVVRRWMCGVAVVCLALTQSKTALLTAVAMAALLVYHDRVRRDERSRRAAPMAVVLVAIAAAVVVLGLTAGAETELVGRGGTLDTGTIEGRGELWADGMEAFRERPLVGAGYEYFRRQAAITGQAWAGQAHNQAVQALTETGLLGFLGLVAYVIALCRYAWLLRDRSRFASVALLAMLLLRCITEVPLEQYTFPHLITAMLLLGWAREAAEDPDGPEPPRAVAVLGRRQLPASFANRQLTEA